MELHVPNKEAIMGSGKHDAPGTLSPFQATGLIEVKDVAEVLAPPEHILQFFAFSHLPQDLQAISAPFAELANELIITLPRNPERTVALRKLLESKDASVRAKLAK